MDLVLHDVMTCLGSGAVAAYITGEDEIQALESMSSSNPELLAHITRPGPAPSTVDVVRVFVPGDTGATGLDSSRFVLFTDLLVAIAEIAQERVMESSSFFGVAFPPCPEHPNTPLWPTERDGEAVWACADGGTVAYRIGTITSN